MTDESQKLDYTVRVSARGGAGRNAMWQWEVYAPGNTLPVEKGIFRGEEARGFQLARAAAERLSQRKARESR